MAYRFTRFHMAMVAGTLAAASLSACGGGGDSATKAPDAAGAAAGGAAAPAAAGGAAASALDPVLASPQVGDLYSGELTHFSEQEFGSGGTAYGMMRVVAVTDTAVTVITETGAYDNQAAATAELNSGSLSNVTWDESEPINITRADLASLQSSGKIAAFRRP
jgi:hypothetical protein